MSPPAAQSSPGTPEAPATPVPAVPVAAPAGGSLFNRRTFLLLTRGPFARYVAGDSISMVGLWMQTFAQGWVMTGLTSSALWLGTVTFASSVPMLALSMYGGSVADRHDKRRIIIIAQSVQTILAVGVGWLVMTHQIHVWHLITAAFLLGITAAFEMPATNALVPELVDKEHISTAIAVDRSVFHGSRLIGPGGRRLAHQHPGAGVGVFTRTPSVSCPRSPPSPRSSRARRARRRRKSSAPAG